MLEPSSSTHPRERNYKHSSVQLVPGSSAAGTASTRSNSSTAGKILQSDLQLSSRCDDCWSSHILSAMNGLTQSYLFKERLLECKPINLSRFVVDLKKRHLDYRTPYSDMHPQERNSQCSTYHEWCALPTKRALVTHLPNTLPTYMLLDLPRVDILSMALRAHTLRIETVTWTHNTSPCRSSTCAMLIMYKIGKHVLFHCTKSTRGLSPKDLCVPNFLPQASTVCLLFWARNSFTSSIMH